LLKEYCQWEQDQLVYEKELVILQELVKEEEKQKQQNIKQKKIELFESLKKELEL